MSAIVETAASPVPLDEAAVYQLERGKPVPGFNHSRVQSRMIAQFTNTHGFEALSELNLDLNGWRCVPDICFFPNSVTALLEDIIWVKETPTLVVEIFSPSQTLETMTDKVDKLLAAGVPSVWLVMPAFRVISIFQKGAAPISATQGILTDPNVPVSVNVDAIFE